MKGFTYTLNTARFAAQRCLLQANSRRRGASVPSRFGIDRSGISQEPREAALGRAQETVVGAGANGAGESDCDL